MATAGNDFDAIIVGSGAGGAAAAYRLVLAGRKVLVLEKGQPLPTDGSTLDDTEVVARGRFLSKEAWVDGKNQPICPEEHFNTGGKTKWYGAAVLRYSAREFLDDAAYAARGWPIPLTEVQPYYEEAEQLLGVRRFAIEPGLKSILDDLYRRDQDWVSEPLPMALAADIRKHPREAQHFDGFASAAHLKGEAEESFLKRISDRPNLSVRNGAEVDQLLQAAAGAARVNGVKLTSGEELRAPLVLLAAGTLHSPRLLQRYLARLGSDAPPGHFAAVGRNLKKHVLTALIGVSLARPVDVLRKTMLTTHARYPHSSVQPLGFDGPLIAMLVPHYVPRFIARIIGRHAYGFFLQTEDGAHPDNRVYERADADGKTLRVMDYDIERIPASKHEHAAFTKAFRQALLRMGMISFTQPVGLNGTAHVSGTLTTGTDPATAAVNPNGQVFGIDGLYVVDGSVLPRSSRVNPSLSIYAWGLRIGDLLTKIPPRQ